MAESMAIDKGGSGSGEEEMWGEGVVLLVAPSAEIGWKTCEGTPLPRFSLGKMFAHA